MKIPLSCVISLAYYSAQKNYILHREMPAGKSFADIVFLDKAKLQFACSDRD